MRLYEDKISLVWRRRREQPRGPTHIERLRGGFGDPLAHFAGDVGASLNVRPSSEDSLQHAEGVGLGAAHHTALARDQRVDQAVVVLRPQLPCARKAALTVNMSGALWECVRLGCVVCFFFTSAVQSLGHRCSRTTAGTQESLAHLPQDRVLHT